MTQIPITILTGFLGSGKTTLLNKIIEQNPSLKFGLIVNEFGEVGIDGQLVEKSDQEMVELSNGCLCCVVRDDLIKTVDKLISSGKVDYILIEASGLAEPAPIADTFVVNNLDGKTLLDGIICMIDVENFENTKKDFSLVVEQLQFCDFIILNKVSSTNTKQTPEIQDLIHSLNPQAKVFINSDTDPVNTKLLIETGSWTLDKLQNYQPEEEHDHNEHHEHNDEDEHQEHKHKHKHNHEHDDIDEIVFKTDKVFDPQKLDDWLGTSFPKNVIRSKGLLKIQTPRGVESYVFQMVGASKMLTPFDPEKTKDLKSSVIVFIGKDLDEVEIFAGVQAAVV
ncbi:MAG: GTP-binding protein [bacterium]